MRILFTSYAGVPAYNDPSEWLHQIAFYTGILEALAQTHEVISIERINWEGAFTQQGVRYYFLRQQQKTRRFPVRIHRLIRKLQPDMVCINGFIFPVQLLQLRWMLGKKTPVVVINRSEKPGTGYRKWLQRLADRCVQAYLFPSVEAGLQWVNKGIIRDRHKLHEVFHGSSVFTPGDKTAARKKLAIPDSLLFLWVGRLNANKDPLTALEAFHRFAREVPAARLYMICHENDLLEKVKETIATLKLKEHVTLAGMVPHAALEDWYRAADFFVSASHYEGGGIAVCEAMSCGVVPVVTDIAPFRTLTGNGACGVLFTPGDAASMHQALHTAVSLNLNAARTKTLAQYRQQFSFEAIARKINQVLQQLQKDA